MAFPGLLGEAMTHYPVALVKAKPGSLYERYASLGRVISGDCVARRLEQSGLADMRFADPDRFGPLIEAFDGGDKVVSHIRSDQLFPFPPGPSLAQGFESTIRLQKKAMLAAIRDTRDKVIFGAFGALWSCRRYQDDAMRRETFLAVTDAVESVIEQALEQEHTVLVCGDEPQAKVLPVMLIHPALEGLRSSKHDVSDERAFPRQPEGSEEQIGTTIAILAQLPRGAKDPAPLFASQLSRIVPPL